MKSKEEHLKYSIGILSRGDAIKDVLKYLKYQEVDESVQDEIVNILYEKLEAGEIVPEKQPAAKAPMVSKDLVMGIVFFVAGIFFIQPMSSRGALLALPIIIMAYGIYKILNHFQVFKK